MSILLSLTFDGINIRVVFSTYSCPFGSLTGTSLSSNSIPCGAGSTKYCFTEWWPTPPGFAEQRIRLNLTSSAAERKHAFSFLYELRFGQLVSSSQPIHVYWWPWYLSQSLSVSTWRIFKVAPLGNTKV